MPGENYVFTTHVDPISPPKITKVVEAPVLAPGSVKLIPQNVYRHSRLPDDYYYRPAKNFCKDHLRFNLRWRAFCAKV